MARVPEVVREQLRPEDQQYFDEIVGSRGSIRGPYGVLLHTPKLAARVAATGAYVRFEGVLSDDLKEVAILATAKEIRSQYEFTAHARLAREVKVSEDTIRSIAEGRAPADLSGDEELVVGYVQELMRNHTVGDATYDAVVSRFGVPGVVELTVLMGHYVMVGQVLAAFAVGPAPGSSQELTP